MTYLAAVSFCRGTLQSAGSGLRLRCPLRAAASQVPHSPSLCSVSAAGWPGGRAARQDRGQECRGVRLRETMPAVWGNTGVPEGLGQAGVGRGGGRVSWSHLCSVPAERLWSPCVVACPICFRRGRCHCVPWACCGSCGIRPPRWSRSGACVLLHFCPCTVFLWPGLPVPRNLLLSSCPQRWGDSAPGLGSERRGRRHCAVGHRGLPPPRRSAACRASEGLVGSHQPHFQGVS